MTSTVFSDLEECPSDILNAAAEAVEALPNRPPFPADILLAIAKAAFAERKEVLRYKSMFDDAVAQHNAQMERAERAEAERDKARQALEPFARFSRCYPDARSDYEVGIAGLHHASVSVTIGDYHRAAAVLDGGARDDS